MSIRSSLKTIPNPQAVAADFRASEGSKVGIAKLTTVATACGFETIPFYTIVAAHPSPLKPFHAQR
jgi:hypothetical protein